MKLTSRFIYFFAFIIISFIGCDISKNDKIDNTESFVRVYENKSFSDAFIPIDIKQKSDGGYVFLCKTRINESSFYGVYVMTTDAKGVYMTGKTLASEMVNPVGNLMAIGGNYYFFCMNATSLATKLMRIDPAGEVAEVSELGATYPLAASAEETTGEIILQYYNREDMQTVLAKVSTSGAVSADIKFDVGAGEFDPEASIINHLAGIGTALPFLTGKIAGGNYYFNGYSNYTFSLVFFSFGSTNIGTMQGYRDQRCISAVLAEGGQKFSLARFNYGSNYFIPHTDVNTTGISSSGDLKGNPLLELTPNARVVIKKVVIKGKTISLYASETKGGQICLYAYENSALLGSKHIGYAYPMNVAGYTATSDNGLAIGGTTYVEGRFARVTLVKLSAKDLESMVN